jgi:hypothetical protein
MPKGLHLCCFRQPPEDKECLEMIWSNGRACKSCYRDDCYRQGWAQQRVDLDNQARIEAKHQQLVYQEASL